MSYPVWVSSFLFSTSLLLSSVVLFSNSAIRDVLKSNWKLILILFLINLAFKIPAFSPFFHGLEYEDAYIYKASARFLEYKDDFTVDPFLTSSCIFGSLKSCQLSSTYSGHVIGYPSVVAFIASIFGYRPNMANYVSLFFSSVTLVVLFCLALNILDDLSYAIAASTVFIAVPIFNVFGSTSLSEPTSNAFLTLALLLYILYMHNPDEEIPSSTWKHRLNWLALLSLSLTLVLIKRENMLFFFVIPFTTFLLSFFSHDVRDDRKPVFLPKKLIKFIVIIILVFFFYILVLNIVDTISVENAEINGNAFSITYSRDLLPLFTEAFFRYKFYFVFSPFLLLGCFLSRRLSFYPLTLFTAYLLLYCVHYRSYFYIAGKALSQVETFRYMTGLLSIYSLVAGLGMLALLKFFRKRSFSSEKLEYAIIVLFLLPSFIQTISLREEFAMDEYCSRVQPVQKTLGLLSNISNGLVITDESLLFQIYGDEDLLLIDLCGIGNEIPEACVNDLIEDHFCVYLQHDRQKDPLWQQRWRNQSNFINSKRKLLIYDGHEEEQDFLIYQIIR